MKFHVDAFAILSYIAGCGGIVGSIAIDPTNHTLKTIVAAISATSLFAGLATRTFFNRTPYPPSSNVPNGTLQSTNVPKGVSNGD